VVVELSKRRSEKREQQTTKRCIEVAAEAFKLFEKQGLDDAGDGLFTSIYMVARHLQRLCPDQLQREAMIQSVTQIIACSALDIDKSILQTNYKI
jgi:hypothetical protein